MSAGDVGVASIASRFTGQSVAQPEAQFRAVSVTRWLAGATSDGERATFADSPAAAPDVSLIPTPQGYAEQQQQNKKAADHAAQLRQAYRGKVRRWWAAALSSQVATDKSALRPLSLMQGDDLMSEFERNRRLEAEARRRAGAMSARRPVGSVTTGATSRSCGWPS
jgi:DNA segregation ATPase FtsK/SpoIIIE-like protein